MFHSISGILTYANDSFAVITTDYGVEWEVSAAFKNAAELLNKPLKVYTYLHHTETALQLFGFLSLADKAVFLQLLSVSGIGPKQALKILSNIQADVLINMIDQEDLDSLSRIPGLGRKTASKIILALKGKLVLSQDDSDSKSGYNDVVQALVDMGFDKKQVKSVFEELQKELAPNLSIKEQEAWIFKHAIVRLS